MTTLGCPVTGYPVFYGSPQDVARTWHVWAGAGGRYKAVAACRRRTTHRSTARNRLGEPNNALASKGELVHSGMFASELIRHLLCLHGKLPRLIKVDWTSR
jgi:hypothetical protein